MTVDIAGRKRPQKKTPEQVAALEHAFEVNPTPTGDEYREIAEQSGLTQAQVEHWFGHRRSKERKKLRESAEVSGVGLGSSMPSMGVMSGHAAPALEGVDLATLIEEASKHLFPEGLRPDAPPLVVDPFGFDPLPCMEEGPKKVVKRKAPAMTQETAAEKKLRLEEARVTRELEKLKQKEEIMAGEGAGEGEEAEARAQVRNKELTGGDTRAWLVSRMRCSLMGHEGVASESDEVLALSDTRA